MTTKQLSPHVLLESCSSHSGVSLPYSVFPSHADYVKPIRICLACLLERVITFEKSDDNLHEQAHRLEKCSVYYDEDIKALKKKVQDLEIHLIAPEEMDKRIEASFNRNFNMRLKRELPKFLVSIFSKK